MVLTGGPYHGRIVNLENDTPPIPLVIPDGAGYAVYLPKFESAANGPLVRNAADEEIYEYSESSTVFANQGGRLAAEERERVAAGGLDLLGRS